MIRIIEEHFVPPDSSHKFSPNSNRWSFQYRWLTRYPWLRYSNVDDGGYCLPCALFFKPRMNNRSDPGVLVTKPLTNFQKALEILGKHQDKQFHKYSVLQMEDFKKVMTNQQPSIRSQLCQVTADQIAHNRQKLKSIFETIILCGHQNIPLRGHCDCFNDVEQDPSGQHGNFWALLNVRVDAGDTLLKDHLSTSRRNATYTSSRIQNEVLDVLGNSITQQIVARVRLALYFTVIADEVTDCSNKEQLAIVLRYVNPDDNVIHEDFVTFIECDSGITGSALSGKILAYDGAGNMSGSLKGTAALISKEYPLAFYLHCASHSLNLAVVKCLEERSVRNMLGVVNRVSIFFDAHPKRQRKLEESIDGNTSSSVQEVKKLKSLCRTRWVERIDALDRFWKLLPFVVSCFEAIYSEGSCKWSRDALTDASTLQLAVTATDFISALVITSSCLGYLMALRKSLQSEAKEIVQAVSEINTCTSVFKDLCDYVDRYHDLWFAEVEKLATAVSTELSLPRMCGRQTNRINTPSQTPKEYYR